MHLRKTTLFPEKYPSKDCYPFNLPNLNTTREVTFERPVTFFVGENGTGKSTLLRAITRRCGIHVWEPEEGRRVQFNRYEHELYQIYQRGVDRRGRTRVIFQLFNFRVFCKHP